MDYVIKQYRFEKDGTYTLHFVTEKEMWDFVQTHQSDAEYKFLVYKLDVCILDFSKQE